MHDQRGGCLTPKALYVKDFYCYPRAMFDHPPTILHTDQIIPFQLEKSGLRGRFIRLHTTLDDILGKHQYPPPVARLTAEAATMACVLGSMLKEDGIFSLQANGDGPISLLVADYTAAGNLRAYASFKGDDLPAVPDRFAELLGHGQLMFTLDRGDDFERYQGIVPIDGDSLTAATRSYFLQSEQIHTLIRFFTTSIGAPWHTAALCIQAMPQSEQTGDHGLEFMPDGWDEAQALLQTLTDHEALDPELHPHDVLFRLFHENGVRVYDSQHIRHQCRCGYERAQRALSTLSDAEAEEFAENKILEVKCEFCNSTYRFTLDDLAALRRH
jgi:molecular chaperone Hsp33